MAYNILPASLVACCTNRADRCPGVPREGTVCFGCGKPATRKTKSGLVCGSDKKDGCAVFAKLRAEKSHAATATSMLDPAFREEVAEKHRVTMLKRYGVPSVIQLPSWQTAMLDRYGVTNPAQSAEIKESTHQRIRAKYGVDHTSQLASTKEAFRRTSQARYGVDNPSQSVELRKEWEAAFTLKHGVHHPMMLEENRQKQRDAFFARYGVTSSLSAPVVQDKMKATMLDRYGVDNPGKYPPFIQQRAQRLMEKYGVPCVFQLESVKQAGRDTNQRLHGVDHHTQYAEGLRRVQASLFSTHSLTLPSGRVVSYQGYEDRAILYLLRTHPEEAIGFNADVVIPWVKKSGKKGAYSPDLTVPSEKLLIEVKSPYTFSCGMADGTLPAKLAASLAAGWQPSVQVWMAGGEEPLFDVSAVDLLADWLLETGDRLPTSLIGEV